MPIEVDPDWWKTMFDDVYLLTDARSVGDETLTRLEVDVVCELLPLQRSHKILDLCGGHGRHTFEFCRRGFSSCTLLDFSQSLIDIARERFASHDNPIQAICADARQIDLPSETFNHVLIMGNSLGYVPEPEADGNIISEAYRLLKPNGWLLVDVVDGAAAKNTFTPNAWHEIGDGTVVCRQRELTGDSISAREMVISKQDGLIRDRTYAIRLYDSQSLASLLRKTGFRQIQVHTDLSPHRFEGDYGFMNRRMLGIGKKLE
ncbi:MAG: methyltransferase domain-containing protein [bacterium]|nr:methyltransferase domain-containing protein [bacterium]